ncbi:MAG TPA: beta-L-arabinofuranosidase domain-containing protein [Bryobacteraceae bacterium]|nr:beta-L-arabinofuranosidase domain-containing protein [Bryobacteraceae bacterium]
MMTRRQMLKAAGAVPVAAALGRAETAALGTFDYSQVELLDSPLRRQFDANHAFFLKLSEDRMLKIYRQRAGMAAPGPDMGGWYDDFCPGAHFGQYVSALARFARSTNSAETGAKVRRLVRGFAETLDPSGKFFVDLRYPGYTYDKLVLALIDAHSYAGDTTALHVLSEMTRAALPHMADHALTPEEAQQRPHKDETYTWDETYTFAENLFLAYERTGDRKYHNLGERYLLDRGFFDPLAEGNNVLTGVHAYSHVNALGSGIQGYLKLGDGKYLRAVKNATDMILKDQSYATGGWGPNESFVEPGKGELGASLRDTHRHFESGCGSYAHFKLMRYLLAITRESRYGDSMERVLYNVALGILPILEDGSTFYYSDYHSSARKSYIRIIPDATYRWDKDDRWPCCSGTLPQLAADYGISAYLRAGDGVYVNLYVPSRVTWKGCSVLQETDYPAGSEVTLTVATKSPAEFTIYLRIPAWAGKGTRVGVNGRRASGELSPGFFAVRRTWRSGDRIELEIDQSLQYEPVDGQTPSQVALLRGPQVMFALAETQPKLSRKQLTSAKIEKAGDDWRARTETGDIRLRPFGGIRDEVYQTYWEVTG